MSKKYLIIMIAACAVCLGIGVILGGGLGENGLFATGVTEVKPVQDVDFASGLKGIEDEIESVKALIAELKDEIKTRENIAREKNARAQEVSAFLSDISGIVKSAKPEVLTQAICDMCNELNIGLGSKPGDTLGRADWKGLETVIKRELDALYSELNAAESNLQSAKDECARAERLLERLKELYNFTLKYA